MRGFEERHVHRFYEHSSEEFSATRYKPWPKVEEFYAKHVHPQSFILDAGSGNGRNTLYPNRTVSVDYSRSLLGIAQTKQQGLAYIRHDLSEKLPFPDNTFDVAISVAVIHHLSTEERRKAAVAHMVSATKVGGHVLLYVWSETPEGCPTKFQGVSHISTDKAALHQSLPHPTSNDVFVGWKKKNTLERYYHLFKEKELEELLSSCPVQVLESGKDRGNYYIVCKKI
ncbi:hypothetical protein NECID01_1190 [Nematocida sp. AWRm77]|nr:hypothetical protein NECID01_1190 [Nematocida sp. AWRm77]